MLTSCCTNTGFQHIVKRMPRILSQLVVNTNIVIKNELLLHKKLIEVTHFQPVMQAGCQALGSTRLLVGGTMYMVPVGTDGRCPCIVIWWCRRAFYPINGLFASGGSPGLAQGRVCR